MLLLLLIILSVPLITLPLSPPSKPEKLTPLNPTESDWKISFASLFAVTIIAFLLILPLPFVQIRL